jgi:hypothetical protein
VTLAMPSEHRGLSYHGTSFPQNEAKKAMVPGKPDETGTGLWPECGLEVCPRPRPFTTCRCATSAARPDCQCSLDKGSDCIWH